MLLNVTTRLVRRVARRVLELMTFGAAPALVLESRHATVLVTLEAIGPQLAGDEDLGKRRLSITARSKCEFLDPSRVANKMNVDREKETDLFQSVNILIREPISLTPIKSQNELFQVLLIQSDGPIVHWFTLPAQSDFYVLF
jgi:hypothetical protein